MTVKCRNCEYAEDCPQSGDPWGQSNGGQWCQYVERYVNQDNQHSKVSPIGQVIENVGKREVEQPSVEEMIIRDIMSVSHQKANQIAKKYSIHRSKVYRIRKRFLKEIRERVKREYVSEKKEGD